MSASNDLAATALGSRTRATATYALELCVVGLVYFALAKLGLMLASINPSATPIWPATGVALAAVLLRGYRVAPAIFVAAFAVNAITAGSLMTSALIGAGNMLEGVVGAWLVNRWSTGARTFETPGGVARFSLVSCLPTALSASLGVASLELAGYAEPGASGSIWLTWWLGDLAGALVVTPVIVLWAESSPSSFLRREFIDSCVLFAATCGVGALCFGPLVEQTAQRAPLGFMAILPLVWSALRRSPRDTATVALILSVFAIWATLSNGGPFGTHALNESFLLLLMFMIGTAVPSLVLSADATLRKRSEEELRHIHGELNHRVEVRTAALRASNLALQEEVDRRRRIEAELDQQRAFLADAQRLANLGSWVRDLEHDRVQWSDQLYEIFGVKLGDGFAASFQGYLGRIHPDDRERVRAEVAHALSSGEGFMAERRIIRPDGEVRHLQTCVEMVKDDSGRVLRMHGICLDITDRKDAEETLERTREQLAQAHKMEAIGKLTGGIAHDFNNLLMIVSGHAEMLKRRVSEPKALQGVDAIMNAARRGESLTRQLLTFSRRQPLNAVAVDLRHRIEAMRSMLTSSLRGNISFSVDVPPDLWPVEVDVAELELALVNIAVNARDAMPDGGSFTVSARNVTVSPGRRGPKPAGDHVEIAFSDTGTGIPADTIKKIFDPFFTTKAVGKGTGLGLSQVYGFVTQSDGVVNVLSEEGRGTTITLSLPRSRAVVLSATDAAEDNGSRARELAEGTVLVVEDNPEVGEVTATLLEQIGYRVLRAENATAALAKLEDGGAVDLLFSDIVMPNGMNGIHLAQEVRQRYPRMRVLLTTGYSDMAASAERQFAILRKPFEVSALERAVREAIAGANGEAAMPRPEPVRSSDARRA